MCTRFFRVDNGLISWFGVDLPTVQPIWHSLIGGSERQQFLADSVLNFNWIEEIPKKSSGKILFIAEGLLMYFSETEVKQLFQKIRNNFPQATIIFDSLGKFLAQNSRLNSGDLGIDTCYKWGIKNLIEIESWNQGIQLLDQWYYLDNHKNRLGLMGLLSYIPMVRRQVKIGLLQFI